MSDTSDINVLLREVRKRKAIATRNKRKRYRPSKLEPHRALIRELINEGASLQEITLLLSSGLVTPRVTVAKSTVYDFVKRMRDEHPL